MIPWDGRASEPVSSLFIYSGERHIGSAQTSWGSSLDEALGCAVTCALVNRRPTGAPVPFNRRVMQSSHNDAPRPSPHMAPDT